jgi:hypothetical protein
LIENVFDELFAMSKSEHSHQEELREVQGTYIECLKCGEKTQYIAKLYTDVKYSRGY